MIVTVQTLPQWATWTRLLADRYMPAAIRGTMSGALRCLPALQSATRSAEPATLGSPRGAVDKGHYLSAWRAVPLQNGSRVYNALAYSAVIEGGRRPAFVNRAGIKNLTGWVQRRMKVRKSQASAVAWAIATKMAPRPFGGGVRLRPRRVMGSTVPLMIRFVQEEVNIELNKELTRG